MHVLLLAVELSRYLWTALDVLALDVQLECYTSFAIFVNTGMLRASTDPLALFMPCMLLLATKLTDGGASGCLGPHSTCRLYIPFSSFVLVVR